MGCFRPLRKMPDTLLLQFLEQLQGRLPLSGLTAPSMSMELSMVTWLQSSREVSSQPLHMQRSQSFLSGPQISEAMGFLSISVPRLPHLSSKHQLTDAECAELLRRAAPDKRGANAGRCRSRCSHKSELEYGIAQRRNRHLPSIASVRCACTDHLATCTVSVFRPYVHFEQLGQRAAL